MALFIRLTHRLLSVKKAEVPPTCIVFSKISTRLIKSIRTPEALNLR